MTASASKPVAATARAWQRMLSGRRLDLLDPSPLDIEIADIAHGLARVARWNGQTSGTHIFSVAQHTLLVEAVMRAQVPRIDARFRLAALLHDAPEYVIGDMISPFKAILGGEYKVVEKTAAGRDPHPLRAAARTRARDHQTDQEGRPGRRLSRGHRAGGLRGGRGQTAVRPRSRPRGSRQPGLFDPLERSQGREAVSWPDSRLWRLERKLRTCFHGLVPRLRPGADPLV